MSARIAICFFGITRSLGDTVASIRRCIVEPASRLGSVDVFVHVFEQKEIDNPRSGEKGKVDPEEYRLLEPTEARTEPPGACLDRFDLDQIRAYGDPWQDGFQSGRNLLHQLHSLEAVTDMAMRRAPDIVVFARPDLLYHDLLGSWISAARGQDAAWLPYWQPWWGCNDRFAIVSGHKNIEAYGRRAQLVQDFCETKKRAIHAERLLAFSLEKAGARIIKIGARASRVRLGGNVHPENFNHPFTDFVLRQVRKAAPRGFGASLAHGIRKAQDLVLGPRYDVYSDRMIDCDVAAEHNLAIAAIPLSDIISPTSKLRD